MSKNPKTAIENADYGTTEQFVCRICGEVLSRLQDYFEHCRRNHKALMCKDQVEAPKKCFMCSVYFATADGLRRHLQSVHAVNADPAALPQAPMYNEEKQTLLQNLVLLPGSSSMEATPTTGIGPSEATDAHSSAKKERKRRMPSNKSELTKRVAITRIEDNNAVVDQQNPINFDKRSKTQAEEIGQEDANKDEAFKCQFCERISRSSRDHVRHVRNCNPNATAFDIFEDPHECPLCRRVFQQRMHLERHFHMKHRGQSWGILDPNISVFDACSNAKLAKRIESVRPKDGK